MKRIYLCCILLILTIGLAVVAVGTWGSGLMEGFQVAASRAQPPPSIKCRLQTQAATTAAAWFCEDKAQADALLAAGTFVIPTDAVCIRKNTQSKIYSCLTKDAAGAYKDIGYLLNRTQNDACSGLIKFVSDLSKNLVRANTLKGIADTTFNTIVATEPNITKLKELYPSLKDFLDTRGGSIATQKTALNTYRTTEMGAAIGNASGSRGALMSILNKTSCEGKV